MIDTSVGRDRLPLQAIVYFVLKIVSVVGGVVAFFCISATASFVWMIFIGIVASIFVRLPPMWFGIPQTND